MFPALTSAQRELVPTDLSPDEAAVWKLLSADQPQHIDDLAEQTGLNITKLTSALLGLEMRELIRQLPVKSFIRKL